DSVKVLAEFTVPSVAGNERLAMQKMSDATSDLPLSEARQERLKTAVAEATMNAMEHGNKFRPDVPVEIRVSASADAIIVDITDHGGDQAIPDAHVPDLEAKLAGLQ